MKNRVDMAHELLCAQVAANTNDDSDSTQLVSDDDIRIAINTVNRICKLAIEAQCGMELDEEEEYYEECYE